MTEGSVSALVFTVFACALWLMVFVWAVRQPTFRERRHQLFILFLATVFWWFSEATAIRLGKYQYALPLAIPLGGGTPNPNNDFVWGVLAFLARLIHRPIGIEGCLKPQSSWDIPFPVVAFEAAVIVAIGRLCFVRVTSTGIRAAAATGGLAALIFITVTAILDPVVSTASWCGTTPDPGYAGLKSFDHWHWFTNEQHTGYWFGVPLINYATWMIPSFTFAFLVRLDDGPGGIIQRFESWWRYLLALALFLVVLFGFQVPLKLGVDVIFHLHTSVYWQSGVIFAAVVLCIWLVRRCGRMDYSARLERNLIAVLFAFPVYCLLALFSEPHLILALVVWPATTAILFLLTAWPMFARAFARTRAPIATNLGS